MPEQIAIVGIGKVEIGPYLPVPLTYVDLPRRETGQRAAELAIALSKGGSGQRSVIRLPVKLVPSASG